MIPPPPSPALGFQVWASSPENAHKVQPSMVAPDAPLQPNADPTQRLYGSGQPSSAGQITPQSKSSPVASLFPDRMATVAPYAPLQPNAPSAWQPGASTALQSPYAFPASQPAPMAAVNPPPLAAQPNAMVAPGWTPQRPTAGAPQQMASANPPQPPPMASVNPPQIQNPMTPPTQSPQQAQLGADTAELQRLRTNGAGLNKIHNPFLRTLARIGDVAGTVISPGLAMAVPGTTMHNQLLQGQQRGVVSGDQDAITFAQKQALTQAELQNAQNPELQTLQTDNGYVTFNPRTGDTRPLMDQSGNLLSPVDKNKPAEPHYTSTSDGKVIAITMDPKTGHPLANVVYQGDPKIETDITPLDIGGKPHNVLVNKRTGEVIKDLGLRGEKPPQVNVNAGTSELDKLANPYRKQYEGASGQLEKIDEADAMLRTGTPESQALAVPKVLTALISGQGTGVRITQSELNAIASARGLGGSIEGKLQEWSGKGKLTPTQTTQLRQVLSDVRTKVAEKQTALDEGITNISNAPDRKTALQHEQRLRARLSGTPNAMTPPSAGSPSGAQPTGKAVSLSAARQLPQNKGKTDAQITADIQAHGHKVKP
jgi:hypothetical protein